MRVPKRGDEEKQRGSPRQPRPCVYVCVCSVTGAELRLAQPPLRRTLVLKPSGMPRV